MAFNVGGVSKTVDLAELRFKPDASRTQTVWLLDDVSEIPWGAFYGIFQGPGKLNASWVGVGFGAGDDAEKVAKELGIVGSKDKTLTASTNAWVNVAVRNSDGTYSVKVWQISKTNHNVLFDIASDGADLKGFPIKVSKQANKWAIQPALATKDKPLAGAELEGLRAQRMTPDELMTFLGPETEADIKAMLIRRVNGANWNDVRKALGLAEVELGGDYEEYN